MGESSPITVTPLPPPQPQQAANPVQDAIDGAGFPAGTAVFKPMRLPPDIHTVGDWLKSKNIPPYSALGLSITNAIETVSLASGYKMTLNRIYGEFMGVDVDALATVIADEAQSKALVASLRKVNAELADAAATAKAALPPLKVRDSVQAQPPSAAAAPNQTLALEPATGGVATQPAAVPPANPASPPQIRELPDHAVFEGVTPKWHKWFSEGRHAEQTLAILLHETTDKVNQDFPAALDRVKEQYGVGDAGGKNLEETLLKLQDGLHDYGYDGRRDGQFGAKMRGAWEKLGELKRTTPASMATITDPLLRKLMRLDEPAPVASRLRLQRAPASPAAEPVSRPPAPAARPALSPAEAPPQAASDAVVPQPAPSPPPRVTAAEPARAATIAPAATTGPIRAFKEPVVLSLLPYGHKTP